jgi:hypothetical protein
MRLRRISLALALTVLSYSSGISAFQILGPLTFSKTNNNNNNNNQEMDLKQTLGIPSGLMNTLIENNKAFSKRIWIVDNSGSMALGDGHLVLSQKNSDATRWSELEETVLLHSQLAAALHQPTEFRMLNAIKGVPQRFMVGLDTMKNSLKQAQTILQKTTPKGTTPLSESVDKISLEIQEMLPQLKETNSKVAIVIVTDGCNYNLQNLGQTEQEINKDLANSLGKLQGLPVSVVVRLCTDHGPLVDFYNDLDEAMDGFDVLDDYLSEATTVGRKNPWLTYSLILHRMREMGQYSQLFDWLDERTLTRQELKEFCTLLFGNADVMPDPDEDWKGFLASIQRLQQEEKLHWNPRTRQMAPWIDLDLLAMLE